MRPTNIALLVMFLGVTLAGCHQDDPARVAPAPATLTIGFGLATGVNPQAGMRQATGVIANEYLLAFANDGTAEPRLARQWSESRDGLSWKIQIHDGVRFHDGTPLTADFVADQLRTQLPNTLGPAFADVREIRATSSTEVELSLYRRSRFVIEALDMWIQKPGSELGAGPFHPAPGEHPIPEMLANPAYYAGPPNIQRITFRQFDSVRTAWAEMLRGNVDMLYEVGVDAIDLLAPSTRAKVFTFRRPYAYIVILNVARPQLSAPSLRRELNGAIDRAEFVSKALNGHGRPADRPVQPDHWASSESSPRWSYKPEPLKLGSHVRFTCLYSDASHERMALLLQRQLQLVGVDMELESVPVDEALERVQSGKFDAWLADAAQGPTMVRQYRFWHTGAPFNWGHYSNAQVDAALDSIRHAASDDEYKAGVAAFQRAIVDDPPAIFLAWSERARAVSTRFDVPVEPGRDILSTLRLWRPAAGARHAETN